MTGLSTLLETHTGQNKRLRDENESMSTTMSTLVESAEKREDQVTNMMTGYQLQITLLEHQVAKANIEKAEVKADMTKDHLELMKKFNIEQERLSAMEEQ